MSSSYERKGVTVNDTVARWVDCVSENARQDISGLLLADKESLSDARFDCIAESCELSACALLSRRRFPESGISTKMK